MSFVKEFREFAVKGNVVDLAVGVIIGAAFGKIVSSLVEDIVMPAIGSLGGADFKSLMWQVGEAKILYGKFIQTCVEFVIIGGFDKGETSILLEWQRIQMSEIQLIPSASFAYRDIYAEQGEVVELIGKGKLPVDKLITHRFKLDEINEAFDVAQEKERTGAVFVAIAIE